MGEESAYSVVNGVPTSQAPANAAQAEVQALQTQKTASAATVRQLQDLVATVTAASRPNSTPVNQVVSYDFDTLTLGNGVEFREWAAYIKLLMEELALDDLLVPNPGANSTSAAWLARDRTARLLLIKGLYKADTATAM